jgi:hypothetical protein
MEEGMLDLSVAQLRAIGAWVLESDTEPLALCHLELGNEKRFELHPIGRSFVR